jgi:hypothetical protein
MKHHKSLAMKAPGLVALVLGLVSMGGIASATSTLVSCTTTFTGPTELNVSLSCPTFNNLLGTLTSIELDFSGGITDSIIIHNTSSTTQSVTASESSLFDLNLLGFGTPVALFTPNPNLTTGSQSLTAGQTKTFPETSGTSIGSVFDTAVLGPYEGNGVTTYALPITTVTAQSIIGGGGNVDVTFATQGTINAVDAIYTYTPSSVPEPATMGLIGTGLLGISLLRRRTTRKS